MFDYQRVKGEDPSDVCWFINEFRNPTSMGISGSKNGGPVPHQAICCGDIL